jgi:hypothetical protein
VGVAVPLWVKAGANQPGIMLKKPDSNHSLMCDWALALKYKIFSIKRGNGYKYMDFNRIHNQSGTGYMQQLAPVEEEIFNLYQKPIERWREKGINLQELKTINTRMETVVKQAYSGLIE